MPTPSITAAQDPACTTDAQSPGQAPPSGTAAIYGAGGGGERFSRVLGRAGVRIGCFIDAFTDRTDVDGRPVVRPTDVVDRQMPVYVSVISLSTGIARQLRRDGFRNVFDFNQTVERFPSLIEDYVPDMLWYSPDFEQVLDQERVSRLRSLLIDRQDRELLDQIIAFRRRPCLEHYVPNDGLTQYFPEDADILGQLPSIRMVDIGAYTGDTFEVARQVFAKTGKPIDYIAMFEPDDRNLQLLLAKVNEAGPSVPTIVYPCGVWSQRQRFSFQSRRDASTIVQAPADGSQETDTTIETVAIDQTLRGMAPNFIKMDIEGAERQAIVGARQTIIDHGPVMAVCLYHRPADLWELPLLLHEFRKDYRFHLRVHGDMGIETVIYALPGFGPAS